MIAGPGDLEAACGAQAKPVDVAVIGAGPVGLAIAHRLMSSGLRIVVLEAGGARFEPKAQEEAFDGFVSPRLHPQLSLYRRRMLGGTSTVWGGRCIPFDPSDFEDAPSGDGGTWPIRYDDVAPYVTQAVSWLNCGEPEFVAREALPAEPAPLIEGVKDTRLSLEEVERFSPPMNAWREWRHAFRAATSVLVAPNAVCTGIDVDAAAPHAKGINIKTPGGKTLRLAPAITVVAAGGLESPRLLLASREGRPQGLGNGHDLLGRFYMTHILADVGWLSILDPKRVHPDYAHSRDGVYVRRLLKLSEDERRRYGLLNAIARPNIPPIGDATHKSAVLSAAFLAKRLIIPEYRRRLVAEDSVHSPLLRHVGNVLSGPDKLVAFGIDWSRRRVLARRKLPSLFLRGGGGVPLEVVAEQAPESGSRVTLSNERDSHGMPRLVVDWRLSVHDTSSLRRTLGIMHEALSGSSIARLSVTATELDQLSEACRPQGGHHIGTARMGRTSRLGVVDEWGALWEASNVYLAGSAIFPRSSAANPTLMAVALAFRTADKIVKVLSGRASSA